MTTQLINGLAVEIDGNGEALLCIHGLGGSSNTWTPLLAGLSDFRVIRPDLPGSARSPLLADPLSIERYAASLEALLAELGVESVHVMAHSLGTVVAQHLAVRNPGKIKSLALFGPLVAPPDAARPNIVARAAAARGGAAAMQEIADAIVKAATSPETKAEQPAVLALVRESVMRQLPEGYAQSCEALAAAQSAEIERIGVPTLLVTGDQDGVAPPANVAAMTARITGSHQVVFDGCGHWTTFEKPQRCMQELEQFYASLR
ncbi:alpha/beta fold hydrolase [Variovorax sp. GT1P44]|uniref:alpha/beta fold hydrolase n=1 Tax=Variovorax sp. GT1P44 TaxID=3443742 RepID=UPI003F46670A